MCQAHPPQFFHFHTHFHQKAPALEVHAPANGSMPPMGNPGPTTATDNVTVTDNTTYVTFDLETGGLSRMSDILQISVAQGKLEFSKYITPMQYYYKGGI